MAKTPKDVRKLAEGAGAKIVDLRFVDLPGVWQHFSLPAKELSRRPVRRRDRLRRVEHPGLSADPGERHAPDRRPRDGLRRPGPRGADHEHDLQRVRPRDPRGLHPRPAAHRAEGRGLPEEHRASPTSATGARRPSSTSSTTSATTRTPSAAITTSTRSRASGTPAGRRARTSATSCGTRKATSPCPPADQLPGPPLGDHPQARGGGRAGRGPSPRGRHRRPGRDRHAVRHPDEDGRQPDVLQVHHQQRLPQARQERDVHAQADLRRQRLGHALPPEPLEGRDEPVLGREGLRPDQRDRPALHRRPAQARPGAAGHLRPDDQLVPPAGARLRGAGQPRLLAAQPVGGGADPDLLARARSRSGSSSAAPTRRPTPTSASPPS